MNGLAGALDKLDQLAKQNMPAESGDYIGNDGLLYCGKCNTPKQCRVQNPFNSEKIDIRHCLCKCKADAMEREEKRRKQEERTRKLQQMGFPLEEMEKMREWNFANDDNTLPQVTAAMKAYVENFEKFRKDGKGLLLSGAVGTGKTYAAVCVANALIDKGYPVLVTSFSRITNTLQGMFEGKQKYLDNLCWFSLVVIDDLGVERKTEYTQEQHYNIIDSFYRAKVPFIVTTNFSLDAMKNPKSIEEQRVYERILERCHPIAVTGKNRRRQNIIAEYEETKNILGI